MNCEVCGRKDILYKAAIEGTELNVCTDCGRFGKVISKIETIREAKPIKPLTKGKKEIIKEETEKIVRDYGEIIKRAREKIGLSQEEFAKKINEKASLVHKLETSTFEPSIELAKKIQRFLKIRITEQVMEDSESLPEKGESALTIGDVIKIKGK